ncbi:MAG TPA: DUF4365 domain-containing protein, partial [Syntrophorhabdus sp.]|nr:DUF4365 domain-containing protein [Syntrophorhabdus sp.]
MDFPKQIRQHKNESDSFAIILYKLKELGIFRNMTSQDYGIDFEIELVENGRVCGHCVKVQVKSSDNLRIGRDGKPAIGGIKQTTLRYWAELSYSIPIIALCVDLKIEKVYMTEPLFWEAVMQLDATENTKTVKFRNNLDDGGIVKRIRDIAKGYSLREELYAHKWLLRNISQIFEMYNDSWWLDRCCQNVDVDFFKTFLDNVRVLMLPVLQNDEKEFSSAEQLFSYDYYYKKSDYDDPYNYVIHDGLSKFFLGLLRLLDFYRKRVLASGYFWVYNDDDYLKLVAET